VTFFSAYFINSRGSSLQFVSKTHFCLETYNNNKKNIFGLLTTFYEGFDTNIYVRLLLVDYVLACIVFYPYFPNYNFLFRGWLHERFSACDLLQIADAIWCICDLVSDTDLQPFTRSMRYRVAIWCMRFGACTISAQLQNGH
jgi:hypothetical protein